MYAFAKKTKLRVNSSGPCPHTRCVVSVGLACDLKISHGQCALSESALCEGTPPVGPWRSVCVSACDIPGALRSRPL
eukprot:scaffold5907_cov120-Isochrysis_galbana.AAC.1